jgi:hypothetical protein
MKAWQVHEMLRLQDVGHGDRAVTSDGLGQGPAGFTQLIRAGTAPELKGRLHDLVGTTGADRMAAGLEPAARRDRDSRIGLEASFLRQAHCFSPSGEAARLE